MTNKKRISFLPNSCQVCKKQKSEVECEICLMISYCCVEHRREHWQQHSHLCRALYKIRLAKGLEHVYEKAVGMSPNDFRQLRHSTAMDCVQHLGRSLESWELEMLYHPKMCNSCFKMRPNELKSCPNCEFAFTCQDTHFNKNHERWCATIKTYVDIVRFVHEEGYPEAIPFQLLTAHLPSMLECTSSFKNIPENKIMSAFMSEVLTYPLTVLSALLTSLPTSQTITVHMVGAELDAEVFPVQKWELYFLHLLPPAVSVKLIMVGPDLRDSEVLPLKSSLDVCDKCKSDKRALSLELVPGMMYHDFIKQTDSRPDLITALNSGLYRSEGIVGFNSWAPTLEKIFSAGGPPVLVTEYTSCEISEDLQLLEKRFPHIQASPPQCNPYASLKPNLNVISDDETPVTFKNYFFTVIHK